jgi:hypothetical protein
VKIISKFRDFYDGVQRTSFDEHVLYIRETKNIELQSHKFLPVDQDRYNVLGNRSRSTLFCAVLTTRNYVAKLEGNLLCFCGKTYTLFRVKIYKNEYRYYEMNDPIWVDTFPTWKDAMVWIQTQTNEEFIIPKYRNKAGHLLGYNEEDALKALETKANEPCDQVHLEFKSPVVLFRFNKTRQIKANYLTPTFEIVVNPCLKDYHFQRIMDAYGTFQEIFMYQSGVLAGPERPMVQLSDKTLISKHGFDVKTSFRKAKETHHKG